MKLLKHPNLRQTYDYDCGAQVLQSVIAYYGVDVAECDIIKSAGTNKEGTSIKGLVRTAKKNGFKIITKSMTVDEVKAYIDQEMPVILMLQAWGRSNSNYAKGWSNGHFVVAIGYDFKKIYFEDPAAIQRTYLTYKELEKRWHDTDTDGTKYKNLGIVLYGKKPKFKLDQVIRMG